MGWPVRLAVQFISLGPTPGLFVDSADQVPYQRIVSGLVMPVDQALYFVNAAQFNQGITVEIENWRKRGLVWIKCEVAKEGGCLCVAHRQDQRSNLGREFALFPEESLGGAMVAAPCHESPEYPSRRRGC